GERWRAKADEPIAVGDNVEVADVRGLVLTIRRRNAGSDGAGQ
ncbi:MAG: hypothetical protein E5X60_22210, partial [Mesorhizobium sp.]